MTFVEWNRDNNFDGTHAKAAWIAALREAAEICRGIDDLGEWGEAAGRCADAIMAKIKAEQN